jgi:hypothetical protein
MKSTLVEHDVRERESDLEASRAKKDSRADVGHGPHFPSPSLSLIIILALPFPLIRN